SLISNSPTMFFTFGFSPIRRPHISTLFPYTTLFRSCSRPSHSQPYERMTKGVCRPCWRRGDTRSFSRASHAARERGSRALPYSRSEEHTSELQSRENLVCRLLLEKKKI